MAMRDILKMGDPRLLRVAKPVKEFDTDALHALVDDMEQAMFAAHGVGIAAPQIGEDWQVVIFGTGQPNVRYPEAQIIPKTVLINPVLEPLTEITEDGWEGCLSVPGMRGMVPRCTRLKYSGFDIKGQRIEREVSDFHARVVQHECDHLMGILYPMRIKDMTQFGFVEVLFPNLDPGSDD
ncbi:MAG: peptide deformylase [Burkholderiaceae bacterium]